MWEFRITLLLKIRWPAKAEQERQAKAQRELRLNIG